MSQEEKYHKCTIDGCNKKFESEHGMKIHRGESHDKSPWKNKRKMVELYVRERMSTREIAEELGCGHSTILRWVDKHGLHKRNKNDERFPRIWDKNWMERKYIEERLTAKEIADKVGCSEGSVQQALSQQNIKLDCSERRNRLRDNSSVGHKINHDGYEEVSVRYAGETDRISVHRLIAIAQNGIDEVKDKVVHHKNGVKWDNRPCNLKVMSDSDHKSHHAKIRGE